MEDLISTENIMAPRLFVLKNLESYIEESIYYRTHSSLFKHNKIKIWSFGQGESKTKIL